jgi:hypothetical protein
MKDLFFKLISASQGQTSSTRLIYLVSGLAAVFCALVMTIGGILEYCMHDKADAVYWTAVAALWTAKLGFGAHEKNEQQKHAAERANPPEHHAMVSVAASASGD